MDNKIIASNNDERFLKGGKISHKQAIEKANSEYEKYRVKQDQQYISSMDEMYKRYLNDNN